MNNNKKIIYSKDNKTIKDLIKVKNPKGIKKSSLFLVEGAKLINEAIKGNFILKYLIKSEDWDNYKSKYRFRDILFIQAVEENAMAIEKNRAQMKELGLITDDKNKNDYAYKDDRKSVLEYENDKYNAAMGYPGQHKTIYVSNNILKLLTDETSPKPILGYFMINEKNKTLLENFGEMKQSQNDYFEFLNKYVLKKEEENAAKKTDKIIEEYKNTEEKKQINNIKNKKTKEKELSLKEKKIEENEKDTAQKKTKSGLNRIKKGIILDNIQDPINVGAIIRSAIAFDFKDIILTNGTANIFSPKAIRGSAGQVFKGRFYKAEPLEIKEFAKKNQCEIIAADVLGEDYSPAKINGSFLILFSNEGSGISEHFKDCKKISIKMQNDVESLNVSVSAALIMKEYSDKS